MAYLCLVFLLLSPQQSSIPNHLKVALSYVGAREATGHNDGEPVETFLRSVGRRKGDSWCAAFVSFCLSRSGVTQPSIRSGLAREFKRGPGLVRSELVLRGCATIASGSIVGWEKGSTISGHIGFVTDQWKGPTGRTIEGNTSSGVKGNQSDGDGVYLRTRTIQPANYFRIMWFIPVTYGNSK